MFINIRPDRKWFDNIQWIFLSRSSHETRFQAASGRCGWKKSLSSDAPINPFRQRVRKLYWSILNLNWFILLNWKGLRRFIFLRSPLLKRNFVERVFSPFLLFFSLFPIIGLDFFLSAHFLSSPSVCPFPRNGKRKVSPREKSMAGARLKGDCVEEWLRHGTSSGEDFLVSWECSANDYGWALIRLSCSDTDWTLEIEGY